MAGWTVQKLIDDGITVRIFCQDSRCNHNAPLDLEKLRDRLGPDAPAMADDLIPKLRCEMCRENKRGERGKKVGLIYSPKTKSDGWPGSSPIS